MDAYALFTSPLKNWVKHEGLTDKQIFVRADLNVPITNGTISDDFRLQAIRPTLDYILKHGGKITLATHIGRPKDQEKELSTNIIRRWLDDHGYDTRITLLENLRFRKEETAWFDTILLTQNHSPRADSPPRSSRVNSERISIEGQRAYAKELAQGIDYYIDDAFASVHDADASLTALPELFDTDHKGIGFLVEHELNELSALKYHAQKPFVIILGGGKAATKLPFLKALIPRVTDIMLCPAVSKPFWQLMHLKPTNSFSPEEEMALHEARQIINLAQQHGVTLHLPQDYLVGTEGWQGKFIYKQASAITDNDTLIAIGPETVALWTPIITQAKTIFFNGPMGDLDKPETVKELKAVLHVITQSNAVSVVGGGNSHAALQLFDLEHKVSFCSTGGGATLAYLSGHDLPALDALL